MGLMDPILERLFALLPAPDSEWPIEQRVKWLRAMAHVFALIYSTDDERWIEVRWSRGNTDADPS